MTALLQRPPAAALARRPLSLTRVAAVPQTLVAAVAGLLGAVVAGTYSLIGFHLHANLFTGMDLTIFDQAVRNLTHFHAPVAPMKAVGMNLWGDHFHPAIIAFVPLYWIWDDPRMLLIGQALGLGLACAVIVRTAVRRLSGHLPDAALLPAGVLLALALATSAGVQFALVFDAHEVAVGVPLLAFAMAALVDGRTRTAVAWSLALLLVKEDASFFVIGVAAVLATRRQWRPAALLAGIVTVWTALAFGVIIPALSPANRWLYSGSLGTPAEIADHLEGALARPGTLTVTATILLAGTAFAAVRSPLALVVLPNLAIRAMSGNQSYWICAYHYSLLPAVALGFAAVDGIARVRSIVARGAFIGALVVVVLLGVHCGPAKPWFDRSDAPRIAAAERALAQVPAGAPVAADVYLTSHLRENHPITQQVRPPAYTDDLGGPLAAQWLVLDRYTPSQGGADGWVPQALDHYLQAGWQIRYDRDGFVVLQAPPA